MMKNFLMITGLTVAGILFTGSASAQISGTYVGAEDGVNTFKSSDGVSAMSTFLGDGDLWHDTTEGSGGNVAYNLAGGKAYEPREPREPDAEIVTTITGLTAGNSYAINVVIGDFIFNTYALSAGFTSGSLTTYPDGSETLPSTGLKAVSTLVDIHEVPIGTATADVNGEIKIFVGPQVPGTRVVYQGISYSEVVTPFLLGDVDLSGAVDFLDISPFIALLSAGGFQGEADCNEDGAVDFLDIGPFIGILSQ